MSWEAVGATAEAIGVILVLVTLIYLSIQVRDAKDQVRRSVQESRHSNLRELYLVPIQNPHLASVCIKTETAWTPNCTSERQLFEAAGLSDEEAFVWQSYQRAWWTHWREVISNRDQLPRDQLDEINLGIKTIFTTTSARTYLDSMAPLESSTLNYIRRILNES